MADTIIGVERKNGISSHTLRFWVKKGLFPFIDRDKNGVKYFSEKDIKWVEWVACLRSINMSLEDIKEYVYLFPQGIDTAPRRKEILQKQLNKVKNDIKNLMKMEEKLQQKIELYDKSIDSKIDLLNPENHQLT